MKQWTRTSAAAVKGWLFSIKRWMYRGGRPARLARMMNRLSEYQSSYGVLVPRSAVTLEVRGRKSGRVIRFPVALTEYQGERYIVSMLGDDANWVSNVRAAGGRAVIRRRGRTTVRLVEVEPAARAPMLRRYLAVAPGARPHIPVDRHAPGAEFGQVAAQFPVFRVTTWPGTGDIQSQRKD